MQTATSTPSIKEVLQKFYSDNNLGEDGGLNKAWAKIKMGSVYIPIPNPPVRRKALVLHDIHHIVTGYNGVWQGEVSISAWELATGCGKLWAAWVLDLGAMGVGMFLYPRSVYKAFIRGLYTHNLYRNSITYEEAVNMKVDELRDKLLLSSYTETKPTAKDNALFTLYALTGIAWVLFPLLVFVFLVMHFI